jgi:hypothetical protein
MATVKVLNPFIYKGKQYAKGESMEMDQKYLDQYTKLNYVEAPPVEKAIPVTKSDKQTNKPPVPRTKN